MTDAHILQLIGLVYIAFGLGTIINKTCYQSIIDEFLRSLPFMFLNGMLALTVGFLIIRYHNTWTCSWSLVVTIFGWLALIKGVLILALPRVMIRFSRTIFKGTTSFLIPGTIILLFGIFIALLGFCVL